METEKVITFIENSFLSPLIKIETITDITYNGENVFYLDNKTGRQKADIKVTHYMIKDFLRQIANLCEKQFSYQNPLLDVSAGKYRINAVHQSIARKGTSEALTFAMRIASNKLMIQPNSTFLSEENTELFDIFLKSHCSIVIGGETGSGKTELQKYLVSRMEVATRIIVIDNVLELDYQNLYTELDINTWQIDDKQQDIKIQELVRNALRNNPDWIIVAESRGAEMLEVLNSSMTGHPIITTIHSLDVESMVDRMTGMVMMNDKKISSEEVKKDIQYHFRVYIYLKRDIDEQGQVTRYINSISYLIKGNLMRIYESDSNDKKYYKLDDSIIKDLKIKNPSKLFDYTFLNRG